MSFGGEDAGELLRARGLRSTTQRRAILNAFRGGRSEHLSADDVYARVVRSLPDLSRATVFATLAEFSELGLLSAFGSPEPVRYETNVESHAHLRCHLCLRVFDLASGRQEPDAISDPGFVVERVDTRAEGVCAECGSYDLGLRSGAGAIRRSGPVDDVLAVSGAAASQVDSPLGTLLLAATEHGVARLAFEDHGDADGLRAHVGARRGGQAARRHLADAAASLQRYFSGEVSRPDCAIDWHQLAPTASALQTTTTIPYASHRSYSDLDQPLSAHDLGRLFGANPIPLLMPCHRVRRGSEIPDSFVGGADRRRWLDVHEQAHPL